MKRYTVVSRRAPAAEKSVAPRALLRELRGWIQQARVSAAQSVDEHLCTLYWRIGTRVRKEILKGKRAEYGARIVSAVGRELGADLAEASPRSPYGICSASPRCSLTRELSLRCGDN